MSETADWAVYLISGPEALDSKVVKNERSMNRLAVRMADLEAKSLS